MDFSKPERRTSRVGRGIWRTPGSFRQPFATAIRISLEQYFSINILLDQRCMGWCAVFEIVVEHFNMKTDKDGGRFFHLGAAISTVDFTQKGSLMGRAFRSRRA